MLSHKGARASASSSNASRTTPCQHLMADVLRAPGPRRPSTSCKAALTSTQAMPVDLTTAKRMRLDALSDSELAVSIYPTFSYNAATGGGWAQLEPVPGQYGKFKAVFDPEGVSIPDLTWQTAAILGVLPIPPPLKIAITTRRLEGTVCTVSGEVELEFDAEFVFSAGPLYTAPPLIVKTLLTTGYTKGRFREGTGQKFGDSLKGRLAGTAQVEKTGDAFMDTFLMLPTDALAIMSAQLTFE